MTDQPDKIDDIFWGALQIASKEQRAAYLDRQCGSSADRRELVEKLLRAQPKAERFLEQPIDVGSITFDSPDESPGAQIGPYRLLQQIGEGGMGVVYMAEQLEPVKRRVAVKIIKPGMDTRQVIDRFEAERQTLSMMDHPNIARVLDVGTSDSGQLYFVMELIDGQPITRYCDEHRLTVRQRLDCFCLSAELSSMRIKRGSSTATSSPRTSSSPSATRRPCPR